MTFAEVLAKTRNDLILSNQTNLAHSVLYIDQSITELREKIHQLEGVKAKITELADTAEIAADATGTLTKELWEEARKLMR